MDMMRGMDTYPNGPAEASELRVERIMAAEYNLAVDRGDYRQANRTLLQMVGQWLWQKVSR